MMSANGGALYLMQTSDFELSYCTFIGNSASTNGGAVFIEYKQLGGGHRPMPNTDKVSIVHCTFDHCSADEYGGAFTSGIGTEKVECDGDIIIENCSFTNCQAKKGGGALMFQDGTREGDEEKKLPTALLINAQLLETVHAFTHVLIHLNCPIPFSEIKIQAIPYI